MMKHAVSHIPFYRSLGINTDSIHCAEDLERFPILTKQHIQHEPRAFVWPHFKRYHLFVSRSSGTTCEPTLTYFDRNAWLFSKYALKAFRVFAVANPIFKRLLIVSEQSPEALERENKASILGNGFLFKQRYISIFDDVSEHVPVIHAYKPELFYGFPSHLLDLISVLEDENLPFPIIPVIFTSSEVLTAASRVRIRRKFQARVYDIYGSSEFKEIAWQCSEGRYHINFQNVFLQTTRHRSLGAEGQKGLLVSGLTNYAMPLLRFDIGDSANVKSGHCLCGRQSPYLENIHGRETDLISLPDGKRISPYRLTTHIETYSSIRKYQLVHKSPSELVVDFVESSGVNASADLSPLAADLEKLLEKSMTVTLNKVTQIARSKSGKHQIVKKVFA
jgi:phenylacetate-CoA ligase